MTTHDDTFVEFVTAASPGLLRTAWFICGDEDEAKDLVQATLEKVYLRWSRLRTEQPLAYARRTMVNQHTDWWRRRRREPLTDQVPDRGVEPAWPSDSDDLMTALRGLSRREREIVALRYYADLPEREVADLLGVSLGTVKSTASRALAKLRLTLTAEGETHV